ncbi:hypothetical protein F0562_017594 [Nyssa sinensis]|uniref:Morc S5 domain-containing protein n=1 Tax=Nyssa sinensis TaxID=561372 RepID=A0A5J4ZJA9_9ASTE|nr:hypothetical protein F0562_017594 [Nyssa sinensis]
MDDNIKQEIIEPSELPAKNRVPSVIDISSSDSDWDSDTDSDDLDVEGSIRKKQKLELSLPVGFLEPLRPEESLPLHAIVPEDSLLSTPAPLAVGLPQPNPVVQSCKQFWKAGDYEASNGSRDSSSNTVGMDHVRVHPKFLHSNATSHKWALGAFAELLDNALDEVCNGATYVHIDMLKNKKDETKMLLVEDNGGGMTPNKMRQCMSLGYSAKSMSANTIGQYGNGFKTSTMRLGADVIVFSRCLGNDGRSPTQSIGILSYTFLRGTGKEDIVVPMIDYEKRGQGWKMMTRSSPDDWNRNLETIVQWSPYESEGDLLHQFNFMEDQGTRIVIYNLWDDDQGSLELDFDTDQYDIQIRGVNRDEKKIQMAKNYPNSRHFLTYQHSLRSYASILYLRIPPGFQITLRGKDVDHHNLVNDMMLTQEVTYRPQPIANAMRKDQNRVVVATIGFVKDAEHHIDIQGFNVYHKNRLIKPFWRVWNASGSDGRGVIGVLEANFVEPAHDKQGFERTNVLERLEARLVSMQKNYWSRNCHKIGYAKRRHLMESISPDGVSKPDKGKSVSRSNSNGRASSDGISKVKSGKRKIKWSPAEDTCEDEMRSALETPARSHCKGSPICEVQDDCTPNGRTDHITGNSCLKAADINGDGHGNANANAGLEKVDGSKMIDLLHDLQYERDRCKSVEAKLQEAQKKIEDLDREQETFINIFSEERYRRDIEEESLRKRLKDASNTIQELIEKVKLLENRRISSCKIEK